MKSVEKLIRIFLVLLIVLSLYFSFSIWVSSAKKGQPVASDTQTATILNERLDTDVFLPLRLIRMQDGKTELNNSENLISTVQAALQKGTFGELSRVVSENSDKFNEYVTLEKGIELVYENSFSLKEYISIYKLGLASDAVDPEHVAEFNCIQVDFIQNRIRFLNFEKKEVYEAILSIDYENMVSILDKTTTTYTPISDQKMIDGHFYYFTESLQMKKYSYILASQPVTKFRNAFFENTEDIQTNGDSSDLSYNTTNEQLTVDESLGTIHFNSIQDAQNRVEGDIYSDSFMYIKKLGTSMGNLHYFNRMDSRINYQTFVEGYPVFSKDYKGQVQIAITAEADDKTAVTIDTSIDTIQVPIPSDEKVSLKSMTDLLEGLKTNNVDTQKISSMVIGYTWHKIKEVTQVVDLTPEWYVCYDNKWYSETALLEQLANMEVN